MSVAKKHPPFGQIWTNRGLKRCPSCGQMNGQRAFLCRNTSCKLRQRMITERLPFEPVLLILGADPTLAGTSIYSIRSKDRYEQARNFVQVKEVTLALEPQKCTAIVSRNTICYVDTCKYDASDAAGLDCKHIKACGSASAKMPLAEVWTVKQDVLYNLNIDLEQKHRLWKLYKEEEHTFAAVQRLNASIFVVKCHKSKHFPAGRLHVTAVSNAAPVQKSNIHACACKKLKIILEPDNSVLMQDDVCDHRILVLAAVLSQENGSTLYARFLKALQSFWLPTPPVITTTLANNSTHEDVLSALRLNMDGISFGGEIREQAAPDDIFIFGDEFLSVNNMPDLSDIIFDLTPSDVPMPQLTANAFGSEKNPGDSHLLFNRDINEQQSNQEMQLVTTKCSSQLATLTAATAANDCVYDADANRINDDSTRHLELSDCNIELMDQFQLTDQIDLCSDDIALSLTESAELLDTNATISILPPSSLCSANNTPQQITTLPVTINTFTTESNDEMLVTSSNVPSADAVNNEAQQLLPQLGDTFELSSTISVLNVDECDMKIGGITMNEQGHKNAVSVPIHSLQKLGPQLEAQNKVMDSALSEPSIAFTSWLDYVIETINESIQMGNQTHIKHCFHVHEDIFLHLSNRFSVGVKRRMPNRTTLVKFGKHKGKFKYTYYFNHACTVKRIFCTNNLTLQVERSFICGQDGALKPYKAESETTKQSSKFKRIFPKMELYLVYIWFDCATNTQKTGFKLQWLPDAFPQSHFGILNIEFSLGMRHPSALKAKPVSETSSA